MKTIVDGNLVLVDDVIVIEKDRGKYKTYVANGRFKDAVVNDSKTNKPINLTDNSKKVEYDTHNYKYSDNGLTLEESVNKAYSKIRHEIFKDASYRTLVEDGIRTIIKRGDGRAACYKLAAEAKKAVNAGCYGQTNAMVVFTAAAKNQIVQPGFAMKYKDTTASMGVVEYDPVYYINGNNGLTVEESASKAAREALDIMLNYVPNTNEYNLVYEGALEMIKDGKGRHSVYILAGNVKKRFAEDVYKGVPQAFVFNGIAKGLISDYV